MKVIYADDWQKRMEKCEEVNRKNKVNYTILRCVLLLLFNVFTFSSLIYVDSMAFANFVVFGSIFGSIIIWTCLARSIAGLEADISSVNENYPFFANIVDEGATVSYLLKEKNAKAIFTDGYCCIEYEKQIRNKTKTEVLKLENVKIVTCAIDEPILDLQKMEFKKPFDEKKEVEVLWQATTDSSSAATKKLAKLKI